MVMYSRGLLVTALQDGVSFLGGRECEFNQSWQDLNWREMKVGGTSMESWRDLNGSEMKVGGTSMKSRRDLNRSEMKVCGTSMKRDIQKCLQKK